MTLAGVALVVFWEHLMPVMTSMNTDFTVCYTLRNATRDVHERLHDHAMFAGLSEGTMSHSDYRALLSALYGFHRPLEIALRKTPAAWWHGLDVQPRLRAHRLAEDLADLGFDWTSAELLPFAKIKPIDTPGRLLGCLYVREGATPGGQVLARSLDPLLGSGDAGRRFLTGTRDTGRLWGEVCDALEAAGDGGHLDDIVEGARATSDAFEIWMNRAHARFSGS
jgi:heme oxygenase (biliverdin-IX-beta and delta-forming)